MKTKQSFWSLIASKVLLLAMILTVSVPTSCLANGGITVNGTRFIFPADASRIEARVANTSDQDNYLIQSWVDTAAGEKSPDVVVTPPLYLSKPDSANMLSLLRTGGHFPTDRETLFYLMVKAIPSVDESQDAGHAVIHVATVTQLKLFLRPRGLKPAPELAARSLTFSRNGHQLVVHNPTPYYLTLTELSSGGKALEDTMVPPLDSVSLPLPTGSGSTITLHNINDYGGISAPLTFSIH
ncbi:fimbrial chaperone protein [Izhakiella capsodis]|uniref:Fimbrial chaperone protein n=1 Tax=Izhakiella capsodis TaxID=1367852 RepID=A0A1I4VZJ3_9GAMM|nr:fimbria/pilus periplasmic chaperone [Izhakiella capsodis]SFN06724.1 fimbrial chaperone protein [Izhakiella capsodis]